MGVRARARVNIKSTFISGDQQVLTPHTEHDAISRGGQPSRLRVKRQAICFIGLSLGRRVRLAWASIYGEMARRVAAEICIMTTTRARRYRDYGSE